MKHFAMRRITALMAVIGTVPLSVFVSATPAQAYCATGYSWPGTYVYTKAGSNVPGGWLATLQISVNEWNGISGANWTIGWSPGSAVNFTIRYATPAGGFGGAPGVTTLQTIGTSVTAGDVYLNPNWSWNQNGNLNQANQVADVQTVTVHELGHELVLTHPSECGSMTTSEVNSAMNPNYTKKWNTNADDKAGAAYMK